MSKSYMHLLRNAPPASLWADIISAWIWLAFLIFPIRAAINASGTWQGKLLFFDIWVFLVLYILYWKNSPYVPEKNYRIQRRQWLLFVLLMLVVIVMPLLGGPEMLFELLYPANFVALTFPTRQMWRTLVGVVVVHIILVGILSVHYSAAYVYPLAGSVLLLMLSCAFSMASLARLIKANRKLKYLNERNNILTKEEERSRISADLHDILGRTLTLISLKADLSARLLDAAQQEGVENKYLQQAQTQILQLHKLAQDSLRDVRKVVQDWNRLSLQGEISSAHTLFETMGVDFVLSGAATDASGLVLEKCGIVSEAEENALAHMIRETVSNVIHHATAAHKIECKINEGELVVINDGIGKSPMPKAANMSVNYNEVALPQININKRSGTGLRALAERLIRFGWQLSYGIEADKWVVRAVKTLPNKNANTVGK